MERGLLCYGKSVAIGVAMKLADYSDGCDDEKYCYGDYRSDDENELFAIGSHHR
jgi:hypothetical protein